MGYVEERLLQLEKAVRPRYKYPPGSTSKVCTRCKTSKPLDEFSDLKLGALGKNPKCKQCIRDLGKEYTRNNREKRAGRPRSTHCDCCDDAGTARRSLHWDHDHVTGQFRGWLCHGCNIALGGVNDDKERLRKLITYLELPRS